MVLVTDASVGRVLGGAQIVPEKNRESFLLSKNVCWCWLRMLLLAEYVPATMLDPKALGTAFDIHWQLVLGGAARTPRPDPSGAKGPSGVPHPNLH